MFAFKRLLDAREKKLCATRCSRFPRLRTSASYAFPETLSVCSYAFTASLQKYKPCPSPICHCLHKTTGTKGGTFHCFLYRLLITRFGAIVCADAAGPLQPTIHSNSIKELQTWLRQMKNALRKSDALLYAPSNDINEKCTTKCLHCYLLELKVIILEEELYNKIIIYNLMNVTGVTDESNNCPPCEAHTVQNSTIFLERLTSFLQRLSSRL